jgi:hypothetical protein
MISQARARVADRGWDNVTLIEASAEEAAIEAAADAALFCFVHDVLQSPRAVANVVAHLKPGARVAGAGAKLAGGWSPIVNYFVRRSARPYMTTFRGLDRPWRELERYTGAFDVRSLALGGAYVASASVSDDAPARAVARSAGAQ